MIINHWWQLMLLVLISYFVGNFCAAIFLSNKFIHKDIRGLGSKNPGTTNMVRVFGIKYGVITLIIDFFKGFLCVMAGKIIFTLLGTTNIGIFAGYLSGLAVILGHNYPIILGFKGGKGFATGIGVFIAVTPVFTLILLAAGVILLLLVDRMSVFALTFFTLEAIYHLFTYGRQFWWITLFTFLYLILAVIAHRSNIVRLIHGEEKPLGIISRLKGEKQPT